MRRVDSFELYIMWFIVITGLIVVPMDMYRADQFQSDLIWGMCLFEGIAFLALIQCVFGCTEKIRAGDTRLSWYYVGYWWTFSYLILVLAVQKPTTFNIFLCAVDVCFSIAYTYFTAEQKAEERGNE